MLYPQLTIEPPAARTTGKGRTFRALLLGYLTADGLWEVGAAAGGAVRPVWLAVFGTVGEAKPFVANLRAGRAARIERGGTLQIPKSSGHRWVTQAVPGGVVTVAYLAGLFHLEPPAPFTEDVRFVMAPARRWVDREAEALGAEFGADARDAARAALFAAYLDRRTPLPLLRDLRFHLQLFQAALEEPWAVEAGDPTAGTSRGLVTCGLDAPVVCSVDQATLGEFLTAQTAAFHRLHGGVEWTGPRYPVGDLAGAIQPVQLALDLGFD
jgi:hypothetical protein